MLEIEQKTRWNGTQPYCKKDLKNKQTNNKNNTVWYSVLTAHLIYLFCINTTQYCKNIRHCEERAFFKYVFRVGINNDCGI